MLINQHLNTFLLGNHLKLLRQQPIPEGFLWEVEKIRSEQACCLRCGSVKTVRAGKCISMVREEPVRQMSLWLKIHKHRIYCKDCKKPLQNQYQVFGLKKDLLKDLQEP